MEVKRGRGAMLTIHPHLMPKLRKYELHLSPQAPSLACSGTTLPLPSFLHFPYISPSISSCEFFFYFSIVSNTAVLFIPSVLSFTLLRYHFPPPFPFIFIYFHVKILFQYLFTSLFHSLPFFRIGAECFEQISMEKYTVGISVIHSTIQVGTELKIQFSPVQTVAFGA
jgi:hypothetical protein